MYRRGKLNGIGGTQVVRRPEAGSFFSDVLGQLDGSKVIRMEQNVTILLREVCITTTERMD